MIYIASPYSHPNEEVRRYRYEKAVAYAAYLMAGVDGPGYLAFSPIVHNHPIAEQMAHSPSGWKFWKKWDEHLMSCCNELHVLMLFGWEESVGVANELEYACRWMLMVKFINPISYGEEPQSDEVRNALRKLLSV